ncbi:MAG: U32 family peptidase, partial [Firmicutes bacterium]|nr:U32 family peptidase [Bacillota bacterium]
MKEITMKDGRKPELLAPSGDMEAVRTAVRFGADAVYLGGPFMQLRASSAGFDEAGLKEASELIHSNGKRMYVTVNCFANNDEIPRLGEYARFLKDLGVDAVIVSDIGAVAQIKENVP